MINLNILKSWSWSKTLIFAGFIFMAILRLINLNYNSPFRDEAIYIVLGKLGIIEGDWWSYGSQNWLGGSLYVYPVMSGLAYQLFGLLGSRLLSVIFSLFTIIFVIKIANLLLIKKAKNIKFLTSLLILFLLGGSTISLYISRLATYDSCAYFFFFSALFYLLKNLQVKVNLNGKLFFLSSALFFLSAMAKFTVLLYLPFVFLYAYSKAKLSRTRFNFWRKYFAYPLIFALAIFGLLNLKSLYVFYQLQASRKDGDFWGLIRYFWQLTRLNWYFFLPATLGLMIKKQWRLWLALSFSSILIFVTHLINLRLATLDKHSFLTITFLTILSAIGITYLYSLLKKSWQKILSLTVLVLTLVSYLKVSYQQSLKYNYLWPNTDRLNSFLSVVVKKDERILTEEGPAVILSAYSPDCAYNITTFDWINYKNNLSLNSYADSVKDSYYDYIELNNNYLPEQHPYHLIRGQITPEISKNYKEVFADINFTVYRKK